MTTDKRTTTDYRLQLLQEMRCQNYDMIRFASYRTACKLRYVQKKVFCKLWIGNKYMKIIVIEIITILIKYLVIILVKYNCF